MSEYTVKYLACNIGHYSSVHVNNSGMKGVSCALTVNMFLTRERTGSEEDEQTNRIYALTLPRRNCTLSSEECPRCYLQTPANVKDTTVSFSITKNNCMDQIYVFLSFQLRFKCYI